MLSKPPSARLYLLIPSYRRWVTPGMTELRIRIAGLTRDDLEIAGLIVTEQDLDTGFTDRRPHRVDPLRAEARLPIPNFHRNGQIRCSLVERRTGREFANASWRLIVKESGGLASMAHFTPRNVAVINNKLTYPKIWRPTDPKLQTSAIVPKLAEIAKAGFTGVLLDQRGLDLRELLEVAGAASDAMLDVIVSPFPSGKYDSERTLDQTAERTRALRSSRGIGGYWFGFDDVDEPAIAELYRTVRSTDSKRFCLLPRSQFGPNDSTPGFQDVVALPVNPSETSASFENAADNGLVTFGEIRVHGAPETPAAKGPEPSETLTPREQFYRQLTAGSSGVLLSSSSLSPDDKSMASLLRELEAITPLLLHGRTIAWPASDEAKKELDGQRISLWQRRDKNAFLLVAINQANDERQVSLPIPPGGSHLYVFGEDRELTLESGRLKETFQPLAVHVYTNDKELARSFPSRDN
ncbi:hypothetical protein Pan216_31240 [Planctomycetes bacterium Pan216]|uniref:Uncharacterized protein n=1 Tax=Kolteria novifilia TaxID=2527975 RepID=A0A518B5L0_9BACT|nr:hypothetical protein Pan216_31240 [Planctomycetes bacterium Pan216]